MPTVTALLHRVFEGPGRDEAATFATVIVAVAVMVAIPVSSVTVSVAGGEPFVPARSRMYRSPHFTALLFFLCFVSSVAFEAMTRSS